MAPAQPQQVVAHGLGQIAHVAIGLDRQRAMALGQFGAVRPVDQRQVAIDRHRCAHRLDELQLPRGIVEMIGAADDMGDAHVGIVHHHCQHISGGAVAAQQHHVVELGVFETHIAQHDIVHDGLAFLPGLQPHHKGFALLLGAGGAIAPAPVIAHRQALGLLLLAHRREFFGARIAAIGFAFGQQLFGHLAVAARAGKLIDHLAVPVQPHPGHTVQNGFHRFRRGTLAVGILDAQQEGAAGVAGIEPVEQSGAGAADMQHACGRGCETQDGFCIFRHDRKDLEQGRGFGNDLRQRTNRSGGPI